MVNKKVWIGAVLLIGLAAAWLLLGDSEEARVKKRFAEASELFSRSADSKKGELVRNARAIRDLLTDPCEVHAAEYDTAGTFSSRDLSQQALAVMMRTVDLSLEFYDLTVAINDEETATATVSARLNWRTAPGENDTNTQELECILKKGQGQWRFYSVTVVDVLEK